MKINSKHFLIHDNNNFSLRFGTSSLGWVGLCALLLSGCVVEGPPRRVVVVGPPVVVAQPAPVVVEGQYTVGSEVVADTAPPEPMTEVVTTSPGVDFIWIPGVWMWEGRWVWSAGHWDRPPRPGMVWVGPRYVYRNGAHVFIRGGWR
ncbi:MAG TPA: hypothetical protein VK737_02995 [Opitutales bacterium]|jgi:hypothetical protein|nr:hypothetical protein [Opitutales bacterium]